MSGPRKVRENLEENKIEENVYRVHIIWVPIEEIKDSYFSLIEMKKY